jgi:hypothetical protein
MFLQKIDDWLISHVFEPIAWWSEYHFGISGMKLYLYLYMIGFTSLGLHAYHKSLFFFTFCDIGLILWQIYSVPHVEARMIKNGGLNTNRTLWWVRVAGAAMVLPILVLDVFILPARISGASLTDFALAALLLALYFGACNALPPGYEERKLVPHTL